MKSILIVTIAGVCLLSAPVAAQTRVSPECAKAFDTLRAQTNLLLDAALHGETIYNLAKDENFTPAVTDSLQACRLDDRAKRTIYDLQSQLSTYQATRDTALRILQSKPPAPAN